jgi:hypothetical protein
MPTTGEKPGKGYYKCIKCWTVILLDNDVDTLPPCPHCENIDFLNSGKLFPWTNNNIEDAIQIIDLDKKLNPSEKEDFKSVIPDLISETPKTNAALQKAKKYMKKFGTSAALSFRQFIIDWSCEFVKKSLQG